MTKVKYLIMILLIGIFLIIIPNISNAAVEATRNIYSNNGSMNFETTGLTLDTTHEYEFGFTKTAAATVDTWYLITEYTDSKAVVNITTSTSKMREVINVVDTAYITIKDKTTDTIILEPYSVNVKIPYLRLTNYSIIKNGRDFNTNESGSIQVALRNAGNSKAHYQYEKITDQNIIDKYKEKKNKILILQILQTK